MYHRFLPVIIFAILLSCSDMSKTNDQSGEIIHHDISVAIDPEKHTIKGTDRITVRFPDYERNTELGFLLNQSITEINLVDSLGISLEKRPIQEASKKFEDIFDEENKDRFNYYLINLEQPDSMANFTVAFEGSIYDTLKTAVQEYARGFATTTGLIDTQGVYLSGTSGWIPTQDGGKFTFKLKTYLPLGWQSISQGEETVRGSDGNLQINEWVCDRPMEEVYLIAGKYIITEDDHHGIKVMTYTYQLDPQLTGRYREATKRYIDMYTNQIGDYPFKKFALAENFWQTGYGMPSFTLLGSQVIRLPFIIGTSYGHEILHNWWGNGVFVDYEKGNWCEGLTNYMADHYYKKLKGEDAAYRRSMLQNYLNYVKESRDFPLSQFTERHDPATQAIGYNKSGMIFHMPHKMVGEKKFFNAIRAFYQNNLFKNASWSDIEDAFRTEHGDDLSWFFDQWVNRAGAPVLKLEDVELTQKDSNWNISLTLSQAKPVYQLHVPIRLSGKIDTTITVFIHEEKNTFNFQISEKPKQVWIDPEFDVFRKLDYTEIPPSLSQTFGAQYSIIILPSAAPKNVFKAYKNLAETWQTSDAILILNDNEITEADLQGKAVWILGSVNKLLPQFIKTLPDEAAIHHETWQINDQEFTQKRHTIVLTTRHPKNPELSWSFLQIDQIDDVPVIGRKLPHYGKYGYLVFDGSQNVYKGEWSVKNSPLIKNVK